MLSSAQRTVLRAIFIPLFCINTLQEERLLDAGIPPVVPIVARSGQNIDQLLDAVVQSYQDWDRR